MGTRTFAQVPPTAGSIALNAAIYGYAGHSLVTPHSALKQLWWTDDRIEKKVTRHFVVSQIRGEEREFLDKPLGFGEGLTDDTYMEWILQRARRLFLVLAEIGKPEQIFGLIDDSLDDDDLPFSFANIKQLELSVEPDHRLNKKCYDTQFLYLLRQLKAGSHIDYGPNEHIPMEHVPKVPPAVSLQCWDRIHFPGDPDNVLLRRKFEFGSDDPRDLQRSEYFSDIEKARFLKHEHICPVWASYTSKESGYVLSDYVPEHTLASFIAQRLPYQFMQVPASERPVLVLEWLHCLTDALASLHHRGTHHGAIRPSNIIIDHDNHIAFADVGVLRTFQKGKKVDKKEVMEYSAPEVHAMLTATPRVNRSEGRARSEDGGSSSGGSRRGSSIFSGSPGTPVSNPPLNSSQVSFSASAPKPRGFRNFSRHLSHESTISECLPLSEPINATAPLPPLIVNGRGTSLASIIATATSNITTITPSLPPPTPAELSPQSTGDNSWSDKSPDSTPTRPTFTPIFSPSFVAGLTPSSPPPSAPSSPLTKSSRSFTLPTLTTAAVAAAGTSSSSSSSSPPTTPTTSSFLSALGLRSTLHKAPSSSNLLPLTTISSTASAKSSSSSSSLGGGVQPSPLPPPNPEAADIFSLGCIYLDVLTWLVKGRLNEFQRYRTAPTTPNLLFAAATATSSSPSTGAASGIGSSAASIRSVRSVRSFLSLRSTGGVSSTWTSTKSLTAGSGGVRKGSGGERMDSSFAANIADGKLDLWMAELREESLRKLERLPRGGARGSTGSTGIGCSVKDEAVWVNGVPEMLKVCWSMLSAEPEDRPSAKQVRGMVEEVLVKGCCIPELCCQGKEWERGGEGEDGGAVSDGVNNSRRGSGGSGGDGRGGRGRRARRTSLAGGDDAKAGAVATAANDGERQWPGTGVHIRSRRIEEAIGVARSGSVPAKRRIVNLPWRKR